MVGFEADPSAMLTLSMRQAIDGAHAVATQTLNRALTLDHDGMLSETDIELSRCLIALVRRDPAAARNSAGIVCQTEAGRSALSDVLRHNQEQLPAGTQKLLGDLVQEPTREHAAQRYSRHRKLLVFAVIGLVASTSLALLGFAIFDRFGVESTGTEANATASGESATLEPTGIPSERLEHLVGLLIVTIRVQWADGPERSVPVATGTAFTVSSDGLLVTSEHIFKDYLNLEPVEFDESDLRILGSELLVAFGPENRDRYEARIVHASSYLDLAVLRIERRTDDFLRFSLDSSRGEDVITVGFPAVASELFDEVNREASMERESDLRAMLERQQLPELDDMLSTDRFTLSVFKGSISAIRATEQGRFVQTDSKMYSGMSGGPLMNGKMEVLGVITMGHSQVEGINAALATPSIRDDLREIAAIPWP